jgi:transcription initiation factor TFIIIB Brf1 subunit/transcription initiation factor TFIIB
MVDIQSLFCIADTFRGTSARDKWFSEFRCVRCPDDGKLVDGCYITGTRIFNDDGLLTCVSCGVSDGHYISDEPEWNGGCNEEGEDPSRVGAPVNTTLFSAEWGSGTIMSVNSKTTYANKRLARINFHTSMNHKDRALHHAYEDLDCVGRKLNLQDSVLLQSKIMYRKFNETVLTRGAIRVGIKANCILRACQDAHIARTTQEIADAFGIPTKDISRTADTFRETIPTEQLKTTQSSDLIGRIFNQVTLPEESRGRIKQKVIRLCEQVQTHPSLMGKTPKGIAAAVLFKVLSEFDISRERIAEMCEVSLPTLIKLENLIKKL